MWLHATFAITQLMSSIGPRVEKKSRSRCTEDQWHLWLQSTGRSVVPSARQSSSQFSRPVRLMPAYARTLDDLPAIPPMTSDPLSEWPRFTTYVLQPRSVGHFGFHCRRIWTPAPLRPLARRGSQHGDHTC